MIKILSGLKLESTLRPMHETKEWLNFVNSNSNKCRMMLVAPGSETSGKHLEESYIKHSSSDTRS